MRFEFHCEAFIERNRSVPYQSLGGTKMSYLDWVTKRAECSSRGVFSRLKTDVQQDILTRNSGLQYPVFRFKNNGDAFSVFVEDETLHLPTVDFKVSDGCIIVSCEGNDFLKATVTLDDKAECTLVVDGKEISDWQFRKMALEKMFFEKRAN
jgi:regulation of enolase protein 1 (concanavalin A-like superfamily)